MGSVALLDLMGGVALHILLDTLALAEQALAVLAFLGPIAVLLQRYEPNRSRLAAELEAFHQVVVDNLSLAFEVFMSGDVAIARKLIAEKAQLRTAELHAAEQHLSRLRDGRPESVESSSLHLDVLRDLKRIHSHICSVAYPVLERAGALQSNRLRVVGDFDASGGRR